MLKEQEITALAIALWGELNPGQRELGIPHIPQIFEKYTLEKYTNEIRNMLWALEFLGYEISKRSAHLPFGAGDMVADPVGTVEKVMVRKPKVGDIVYYMGPDAAGFCGHFAAIVTSVESGSFNVQLTAFVPRHSDGLVAFAFEDHESTPGRMNSWHFPEMCKCYA